MHRDFLANGMPIFPLWAILPDGSCECGEECKAAGKHPRGQGWQNSPLWSDDQVDFMEDSDQLVSGYGVVVSGGLLVIDVDARNGGVESFERLVQKHPEISQAGFIVETGSGGGSRHYYFRVVPPAALVQAVAEYPGIDFKSTGYVVGPGSKHVSGREYIIVHGDPADIGQPPASLVKALTKADRFRTSMDGQNVDVSADDIASMLSVLDPDCGYEQWIRIGMAVHQATGGTGVELWSAWSENSVKYPGQKQIDAHWHSFGKRENPVTLGTLYHYATQAGWSWPVTFEGGDVDATIPVQPASSDTDGPGSGLEDLSSVDLLRPPGFVGKLADWINARCLYPRERLAVAGALTVMSAVAGLRYRDTLDQITGNVFCFGVAGSATGKESVLKAVQELLLAGGVAPAIHGGLKSEQEIFRNLLHHQSAIYIVDEMGEVLSKLSQARKSGATPYLQGVIGQLMSAYSKADSYLPVTGDIKRSVTKELLGGIKSILDTHGDHPTDPVVASTLERLRKNLESVDLGIREPYLMLFGLTTPGVFDSLMTEDMAANGFLGRCIIFREGDDNPQSKPRATYMPPRSVPYKIEGALRAMYAPGMSEIPGIVARHGDLEYIDTTKEACEMLDAVSQAFWMEAERHTDGTGLTAIPRRGYELVAKVSLLLAIPEGVRTAEHVRWAYALIKRDIDNKITTTHSNSASTQNEQMISRIMSLVDPSDGITLGRVVNRCSKWKKEDVYDALAFMVERGLLRCEEASASRGGGRITKKYFVA